MDMYKHRVSIGDVVNSFKMRMWGSLLKCGGLDEMTIEFE